MDFQATLAYFFVFFPNAIHLGSTTFSLSVDISVLQMTALYCKWQFEAQNQTLVKRTGMACWDARDIIWTYLVCVPSVTLWGKMVRLGQRL